MDNIRRKVLGNSRLIAELFTVGMISTKILFHCINELISQANTHIDRQVHNFVEDKIEAACMLIKISREKLSAQQSQNTKIAEVLQTLRDMVDQRQTTNRARFMMMNILDLETD